MENIKKIKEIHEKYMNNKPQSASEYSEIVELVGDFNSKYNDKNLDSLTFIN